MLYNNINEMPSAIIGGNEYFLEGQDITSMNPFTGEILWSAKQTTMELVEKAVTTSKEHQVSWAKKPVEERIAVLQRFIELVDEEKESLTQLLSIEAGKPSWESKTEVRSLITKFEAAVDAYSTRVKESSRVVRGMTSKTKYKPHGTMVVLGPYNFPFSMSNGHIMPALLAGNSVIYKPSEFTSLCGLLITQIWHKAGLPPGVLNTVTGGKDIGQQLIRHPNINGVLFVGSYSAGMSIAESLSQDPNKILVLEMGGNSPLLLEDFSALKLKEILSIIVHSTYITSGQRCSAARRLLINKKNKSIIEPLVKVLEHLKIGNYDGSPEPFYGPMIRPHLAEKVQDRCQALINGGAKPLTDMRVFGPNNTMVSPGLFDLTNCSNDTDEEIFGPVLKLQFYDDLAEGIRLANNTKFGLSAGILTASEEKYNQFYGSVDAGIINWNQQLTGATTFAPFGGIKHSGNFRPSGYLSADYCSYATASFEVDENDLKLSNTPGIQF